MVRIGLNNLYYALVLSDTAGGATTYDTPVRVTGAITANINPNSSTETLFADDGPFVVSSTLGQIELELNVADLPIETQAVWLGHTLNNGVLERRSDSIPPFMAVGFRSLKTNGNYRYKWLLKGKAQEPESGNETKTDSVNFQTPTVTLAFVTRESDQLWERTGDEDHPDFDSSQAANWFADPNGGGTVDNTPPTVSSSNPADGATAVAVSTSPTVTFSESIRSSTVTNSNVLLVNNNTGAVIAATLTISSGNTIVTINPTSDLAASTSHSIILTAGILDDAGNALVPVTIEFTTA